MAEKKLSSKARRKLRTLLAFADRLVRDMILERGGNASNVRRAGPWADRTLGETATAAVEGDTSAVRAIKIVKEAKRLGEKH